MTSRRGIHGQVIEVESLEQLDGLVASGATSMAGGGCRGST